MTKKKRFVINSLQFQIKTKDEQKYKRVHEEVLKRVDKYENDNQPQVSRKLIYWFCFIVFIL